MKRMKRHKMKQEVAETSRSRFRDEGEQDLAYYIHDRVELMHQVFSVIKPKELKAMAPNCVLHITVDDLQELCTEELLGISSKRLCAILDGAEPPTDTESSSSEHNIETISLDSISSDDEILSPKSSKKKHKHKKHRKSKNKSKGSRSDRDRGEDESREEEDRSKASRAGLTVLELLELQARARAIRAQLQQDNAIANLVQQPTQKNTKDSSEDEVEIKEEPSEVVEISSEDEKPKVEELGDKSTTPNIEDPASTTKTATKRNNDLVVNVPQTKQSRKIVLNRNKRVPTLSSTSEVSKTNDTSLDDATRSKASDTATDSNSVQNSTANVAKQNTQVSEAVNNVSTKPANNKANKKKKSKKKGRKSDKEEDHDEITLQLSDTEKMDLLENLDRKQFENFTSSSEDSESSSGSSSGNDTSDSAVDTRKNNKVSKSTNSGNIDKSLPTQGKTNRNDNNCATNKSDDDKIVSDERELASDSNCTNNDDKDDNSSSNHQENTVNGNKLSKKKLKTVTDRTHNLVEDPICNMKSNDFEPTSPKDDADSTTDDNKSIDTDALKKYNNESNTSKDTDELSNNTPLYEVNTSKSLEVAKSNQSDKIRILDTIIIQVSNINIVSEPNDQRNDKCITASEDVERSVSQVLRGESDHSNQGMCGDTLNMLPQTVDTSDNVEEGEIMNTNKNLSDGEISENDGLPTNAVKCNQPDVVRVSEEHGDKKKKKRKKDKKSKKEKKSKKSKSDFHEGADQNFFRENFQLVEHENKSDPINKERDDIVLLDDDNDIYEILELSDDSSCYEVAGISVSKEPTVTEIAALSAKIDEINTDEVIIVNGDGEENAASPKNNENIGEDLENVSWRDRYLGSKKVKRVLTTSNIMNALRKKNKELKRKLEESKQKVQEVTVGEQQVLEEISDFAEGSIEHFNTLEGSTNYVDPMVLEDQKEKAIEEGKEKDGAIKEVTKEMEKDAKQLLKMYKRLLKYNDMNKKKEKDPSRKKKKKHKKSKDAVVREK